MKIRPTLEHYIPILDWLPTYGRHALIRDGFAAIVVSLLLVPQALAYALLAGVPPKAGLYASMLPLLAYAVFGTSRTLAVGPFAVVSIMTAAAISQVVAQTGVDAVTAAAALAMLVGAILVAMGLLRLGSLVNFLSHPVISGFISASGILIGASQIGHMLGITAQGQTLWELAHHLWLQRDNFEGLTLCIGAVSLLLLFAVQHYLKGALMALGLADRHAELGAKGGPFLVVAVATAISVGCQLGRHGVMIVGEVPSGLPTLAWPNLSWGILNELWAPALMISIVAFAESVAMAQTLAARRHEQIKPDQELIGLGTANLASAISGGFPISASLSRTTVNDDAGAITPAAGALTAVAVAVAALYLTSLLYYLPLVVLAAIIIKAITALVDIRSFGRVWRYSRHDGLAQISTFIVTLLAGVSMGLLVGVGLSLVLYLYRTSHPHSTVVGRVPGSEHFRSALRHHVETDLSLAILRVDESLYFANARFLEDTVADLVMDTPDLRDLVLMCPAVNYIDVSALNSLDMIRQRLEAAGIRLHLAEVKGPVMDQLRQTEFLRQINGRVFLSTYDAWTQLRVTGNNSPI